MDFAFLLTWQILGKELAYMQAEPALGIAISRYFRRPHACSCVRSLPPAAIFSREALRGYCDSVLATLPSIFINIGVG